LRVAIITTGVLPVPAVRGGAVESLVDNIIGENEKSGQLQLEIVSIFDEEAEQKSMQYKHSDFVFFRPYRLIELLDKFIYLVAKDIFKIKKNMSYRYILRRLYFIQSTADLLHRKDYDRIVLENHPTLFMALKKKNNAKKYEGRYIFHVHNEIADVYRCGDLIKNCKKILTVSKFINSSLTKSIKGIPPGKLDVLLNGIDTVRFGNNVQPCAKEAMRKEYGIRSDEKVVIFSGRLTPEKGIKELLLAFKKIDYKKVKLIVVGSYFFESDTASPFEEELKALVEEIRDSVIFTGFIPYKKMQLYYGMADIAVLPSVWSEPAGLTVIEAMASGLPIITTNMGGIPEYTNDRCGIIVENSDRLVENLAAAMENLLSDDSLRERMSDEALRTSCDLNLENYYRNFVKKLK